MLWSAWLCAWHFLFSCLSASAFMRWTVPTWDRFLSRNLFMYMILYRKRRNFRSPIFGLSNLDAFNFQLLFNGRKFENEENFLRCNFSQSRTYYMCLSLCSYEIRLKWQRPLPWSSYMWEATMFIRMCGQMLLMKSWCGEGNFHDVYAVSVMKDKEHRRWPLAQENIACHVTVLY